MPSKSFGLTDDSFSVEASFAWASASASKRLVASVLASGSLLLGSSTRKSRGVVLYYSKHSLPLTLGRCYPQFFWIDLGIVWQQSKTGNCFQAHHIPDAR